MEAGKQPDRLGENLVGIEFGCAIRWLGDVRVELAQLIAALARGRQRLLDLPLAVETRLVGIRADHEWNAAFMSRRKSSGHVFAHQDSIHRGREAAFGFGEQFLFGRKQPRRRDDAQIRLLPKRRHELPAHGLRLLHRAQARAAGQRLQNGFLEQIERLRTQHQQRDRCRACAAAEQGDVVRIAPEGRDVVVHPMQRRDLVHQAVIAGATFRQRGMSEPAERAETIIHGDHDEAGLRELCTVEQRIVRGAADEAAVMDEDHHRQRAVDAEGTEYVEREAVLARARQRGLKARRAVLIGGAHLGVLGRCLRWAPAQCADRSRRVGQPLERRHLALDRAEHLSFTRQRERKLPDRLSDGSTVPAEE